MKTQTGYKKAARLIPIFLILICGVCLIFFLHQKDSPVVETLGEGGTIKWVDFNIPYETLCKAYEVDIATYKEEKHIDWVELLAYIAAKTGGNFKGSMEKEIDKIVEKVQTEDTTIAEEGKELKYYDYYYQAYSAVLSAYVGEYKIQTQNENGEMVWEERYGLKAFSPIAKGFEYNDYDDFGSSRSYGYKRLHLGHDMMGQIGTPIIAVESGTVEAIGWNQYGGWRIGIRSFDKKRYYYYAHLRQNYPYAEGLEIGSTVTAGDVIGYMGHTGYSTTENVNNIKVTHLHFGIELIFDEERRAAGNEIWIDCYQLARFLYRNRSEVEKVGDTREWKRKYMMEEEQTGETQIEEQPEQKREQESQEQENQEQKDQGQEN